MRVRIHRGAHEIGGNCIELASGTDRIVLDVGRPLSAGWDDDVPLPDVAGLAGGDPTLRGVVLSHPHLDHYGLTAQLGADVPVYMGAEAERVLQAATFFSPISRAPHLAGHLSDRARLHLGPFTITPYLIDHSAFDAYSLLVEADGRRLFYSGDLRAHGRKGGLFERLVAHPPTVDVLLMEGTNVRADGRASAPSSERSVEHDLIERFTSTEGMVAMFSSAQNIDRLVTAYRAAVQAGRTLVVDLYTATVAAATGRPSIPQPGFPGLAVYVPQRQRVRVKESEEFDRVKNIRDVRVFQEELLREPQRYVFLGASSAAGELVRGGVLAGGTAVWSLWHGYLTQPSGQRLVQLLQRAGVPLYEHHTSGHATLADLQRLASAFAPARLVPIHSEATDRFGDYFGGVEPHADGTWWDV